MTPDPRGRPTDEEYIKHLEFFNEQLRIENRELRRKLFQRKAILRKLAALLLYTLLFLPITIGKMMDKTNEIRDRESQDRLSGQD